MEESFTLFELNSMIRQSLRAAFPSTYWVRAEISELKVNQSGHCYLEFVEKEARSNSVVARMRGMIWANLYRVLKSSFEQETGQPFSPGVKVLVAAQVEFHEQYGLSLQVRDIDSSFTLGEMALHRKQVLMRLEEDGILTLNKELEMVDVPQRIAVISSPMAAGYEDFMNQLSTKKGGISFYTRLFPAVMQGEKTEESIIAALDRIYSHCDKFDVVVIIRGGGAVADLASFDSYELAAHCAQFPLPIITGIGHEKDDSVVDIVAHTRLKTPTAAAEFLIARCEAVAERVERSADAIVQSVERIMSLQRQLIDRISESVFRNAQNQSEAHAKEISFLRERIFSRMDTLLKGERQRLEQRRELIRTQSGNMITGQSDKLEFLWEKVIGLSNHIVKEQRIHLDYREQMIEAISPMNVLKRGYTLTFKGKKRIHSSSEISPGDKLSILFADGRVEGVAELTETDDPSS